MTHFPIPLEDFEQHTAILATTGSGKSSLLRRALEEFYDTRRQFIAIDTLASLWGVTAKGPGGEGLEIPIFGGRRGHVPIEATGGAALANLLLDKRLSAIVDVTGWPRVTKDGRPSGSQFLSDFFGVLLQRNEESLHLIVDEVQTWAPESGSGLSVGPAAEQLITIASQGRGQGLHLLMTCQRPQQLDKNVLNLATAAVVMRMTGNTDRKVASRHVDSALDIPVKEFEKSLPGLARGRGYLWRSDSGELPLVQFPLPRTFDSSATPRHGDKRPEPVAFTSALLDSLRAALAPPKPVDEPAAKGAKTSPAAAVPDQALTARVAELEKQAENLVRQRDALIDSYELRLKGNREIFDKIRALLPFPILAPGDDLEFKPGLVGTPARPDMTDIHTPTSKPTAKIIERAIPSNSEGIPPRQQRIIDAVQWCATLLRRPSSPRNLVAWIAGTSASSSGYEKDLGRLRTLNMISYPSPGEVALTDDGGFIAAPIDVLPTPEALREAIYARLEPRHVELMRAAVRIWPDAYTRVDLAEALGKSATSSGFEKDLGRLRTMGLIEYPGQGMVRAADFLMGEVRG